MQPRASEGGVPIRTRFQILDNRLDGGVGAEDARVRPVGYSRFCELYQRWRSKLDVVLRQEHKAGEKMFVDWAGATIPVYDRQTGQAWPAQLFVAALGASSYTWAEATRDQQMESWPRAHVHALEHFGGIPALTVPDNTRTGVTRAHRYDPGLHPTYYNFALHCGFGIVPARPYKPGDKAVVELDRGGLASPQVLLARQTGPETVTQRTVRSERVVPRPRQHRLPRDLRFQSLQRALQPGARTGGDPLHAHHRRAPAQRHARGIASAQPWQRADTHE
jgi:transposase